MGSVKTWFLSLQLQICYEDQYNHVSRKRVEFYFGLNLSYQLA